MSELTPRPESRSELRPRNNGTKLAGIARHGQLRKAGPAGAIFKFLAAALAVVLVSGASVAAVAFNSVYSEIDTVDLVQETPGPIPEIGAIEGGFNILIVGTDQCETAPEDCGERGSARLNDVNMLLHVSQDQTNAVAISFPRDMVVGIPECDWEDGRGKKVYSTEPINVALYYGGLPCVAQTVSLLTGLEIQFAGMITFNGVIAMSDAIGGVPVCTTGPMIDSDSGINITEGGTHNLQGFEALAFLRSRQAVGDGSDLTRISSQQVYLSSLVRTLKSSETLNDPKKLYNLALAAVQNMQLSSSMASPTVMVSIARALSNIPLERVTFVQYPGNTGSTEALYAGKVKPNKVLGEQMMELIRADQPFQLDEAGDGRGSVLDPNAPVAPEPDPNASVDPSATAEAPVDNSGLPTVSNVRGQTAADYTCSNTR
jgi:LCP family protein required for cell wall assembly